MRGTNQASADAAVAALCPSCGLCCNGVLFANVELKRDDRVRALNALGLAVRPKGWAGKRCFNQPCPAFQNSLCSIYASRPVQCRAFECGQVKRLAAGEITAAAALKTIRRARALASQVMDLLR